MNIIGISGKISSGKDTVAEIIQVYDYINKYSHSWEFDSNYNLYLEQHNSYRIKYFADALRKVVSILTGMPENMLKKRYVKGMSAGYTWGFATYRELLQKIGTNALREVVNENVWVNALFATYDPTQRWLIPDTRFLNEAHIIKENGGIVIRVQRSDNQSNGHQSETDLDSYEFDAIILNNDSIENLIKSIGNFLSSRNIIDFDIKKNHIKYIENKLKSNELHRGEVSSIYKIPINE